MRIEDDVKLDFDDVLIRPKRSELRSRKEVQITRTYIFKHSEFVWDGVPIMASNMDTVATPEMNDALKKFGMITVLHKFYSPEELNKMIVPYNTSVSIGASEKDLEILKQINVDYNFITIDVANGYGEYLADFVKRVREEYPSKTIIAGNVVTVDMTEQLILAGADIVKVGIGPGCFLPGTKVLTKDGLKPIEEINIGDEVITHKGNWQKVTNRFEYDNTEKVVSINGIKSTKKHEYYVVEKKYKDILTDENIHEYAEWVPAFFVDKEKHLLIKHKNS